MTARKMTATDPTRMDRVVRGDGEGRALMETIFRTPSGSLEVSQRKGGDFVVIVRRPTLKGNVQAQSIIMTKSEIENLADAIVGRRGI